MKDTIKVNEVCVFPSNIADITSISMECNYECNEEEVKGDFLIEGTYRAYELSINQENFSYKIPFTYTFSKKIIDDSGTVNINDFTYEVDGKELHVDIEYEVCAEEKEEEEKEEEFIDEDAFDRFILDNDNDIEIVDLTEEECAPEEVNEEVPPVEEEKPIEKEEEGKVTTNENITETIMDNMRSEDEYITYHIYVCTDTDTLETIANKFKVSIDIIKNYNTVDNITAGLKLIIPECNE